MDNSNELEIGFLIELAITGEASEQQFEEVMTRIESEPETAELYRQALAERKLMETQIGDAQESLTRQQQQDAQKIREQELAAEQDRLRRENELNQDM